MDVEGKELSLEEKEKKLCEIITALGKVAVAFSGGVDSSYLLAMCIDVLGSENVLALTADSPLLPREELQRARHVAESLGARHKVVPFDELRIPQVVANVPKRCYYCKKARFQALWEITKAELPGSQLVHGENADDQKDYRPGSQAARELGVRAPLLEAGLSKQEIRELSRRRGLPTWSLPAAACLATRFPYGVRLTLEGLRRVEQGEKFLRRVLGVALLRLRDHFPIARLELSSDQLERVVANSALRREVVQGLRALGYRYITLDLEGYRMGSMNVGLERF
ncbi:MAG: ATP-dependent sacrificial sulfur transferase LarE [Anaerolineae bacterium]|nr:ATP-dependent sacrificial sulfur transferase LarE [Anaerolineae bacterium]